MFTITIISYMTQQASTGTLVSSSTFARGQHGYVSLLLARGNIDMPGRLYVRLCHAFLATIKIL